MSNRKTRKPNIAEYRDASHYVIGNPFASYHKFVTDSLEWLSAEYGDVHVEFHREAGWKVSSCLIGDGEWDGWITGDGTLPGCLLAAIQRHRDA